MAKLLYALLLLVALISHSNADIKTVTLTSDPRLVILLQKFDFTSFGKVTISAYDVSVRPSLRRPMEPSRLGFLLLPEKALTQVLLEVQQNPDFCILDSRYIHLLFTFEDLSLPPRSFFNCTYSIFSPMGYSLYFANCDPKARVSMNVHTELYNLDFRGSKNYLSNGQSRLIPLFFYFSLACLFLLVLWAYYCYFDKETTDLVHHLITGLITAKTLSLICAGLDKYFVELTGLRHGWEILFRVVHITSSLIITALIIIGLLFFKQFWSEAEAKLWIVPIALQLLSNLAFPFAVMMGTTSPSVMLVLVLLDLICTCTILVTSGRSIWMLKGAAKTDEKTVMRLAKMKKFALLYILAIAYFYVVPVVAITLRIFRAQQYEWVSNAVEEAANLTICVVTLCIFWPANDYISLGEEDENEETMAVANEESQV